MHSWIYELLNYSAQLSLVCTARFLTFLRFQPHYMALHFGLMLNSVDLQHHLPIFMHNPQSTRWMVVKGRNGQIQMMHLLCPLPLRTLLPIGSRYNVYIYMFPFLMQIHGCNCIHKTTSWCFYLLSWRVYGGRWMRVFWNCMLWINLKPKLNGCGLLNLKFSSEVFLHLNKSGLQQYDNFLIGWLD